MRVEWGGRGSGWEESDWRKEKSWVWRESVKGECQLKGVGGEAGEAWW